MLLGGCFGAGINHFYLYFCSATLQDHTDMDIGALVKQPQKLLDVCEQYELEVTSSPFSLVLSTPHISTTSTHTNRPLEQQQTKRN